jgi:glutamate 5-kinase
MTTRLRAASARRLVVKLGTQVVTRDDRRFALGRVTGIMETLARVPSRQHTPTKV